MSLPLDFSGTPVAFDACAVRPGSGKDSDDVPWYSLKFLFKEKAAWEAFQEANLKGATFRVTFQRVDEEGEPVVAKVRRHMSAFEVEAIGLCGDEAFQAFVALDYKYGSSEKEARRYMLDECMAEHRWQIEKSRPSMLAYVKMVKGFEEWRSKHI